MRHRWENLQDNLAGDHVMLRRMCSRCGARQHQYRPIHPRYEEEGDYRWEYVSGPLKCSDTCEHEWRHLGDSLDGDHLTMSRRCGLCGLEQYQQRPIHPRYEVEGDYRWHYAGRS